MASTDPVGPGPQENLGAWASRPITDPIQIGPLGSLQDLKNLRKEQDRQVGRGEEWGSGGAPI